MERYLLKRSTVFLTILGISVLLVGAGLVLTFPSQTFFSDSYTAKLYLDLGFISGYPLGDYFISFISPGYEQIQYVQYPITSVNYFGGFLASNSPVNVTAFGILGFPYGEPLFEVDNTFLATYFTGLYSNPLASRGLMLLV